MAGFAFSAYLLHTHIYVRALYSEIGKYANTTFSPLLTMLAVIFLIFMLCVAIDFFGNKLFGLVYTMSSKIIKK